MDLAACVPPDLVIDTAGSDCEAPGGRCTLGDSGQAPRQPIEDLVPHGLTVARARSAVPAETVPGRTAGAAVGADDAVRTRVGGDDRGRGRAAQRAQRRGRLRPDLRALPGNNGQALSRPGPGPVPAADRELGADTILEHVHAEVRDVPGDQQQALRTAVRTWYASAPERAAAAMPTKA